MSIYGKQVGAPYLGHTTDVIGKVEASAAGNLILRVGSVNPDGSWTQHKHVVLTPAEVVDFVNEIGDVLGIDIAAFLRSQPVR